VLGLALTAVLAFGAVVASGAQAAPGYKVQGAFLEGGKTESIAGAGAGAVTFKVTAGGPTFEASGGCTLTGSIVGTFPGTTSDTRLQCAGVKVSSEGGAGCIVQSAGAPGGVIATNYLSGTLWGFESGSTAGLEFVPKTGKSFSLLSFWVTGCSLEKYYEFYGKIRGQFGSVKTEALANTLTFDKAGLTYGSGGKEVQMTGASSIALGSGKKWGVFPH
jgi:hypothetical protein